MNRLVVTVLLLLVAAPWTNASKGEKHPGYVVCNGKLCDCDKTGEVNCDNQALTRANLDPVVEAENVKLVSMKSNQITRIRKNEIMVGQGTRVIHLYLNDNLISQIDDSAFESMVSLETLDLSNNKLTALTTDTFNGSSTLVELWLKHNLIEDLSNVSAFAGLRKLRYLSLDWTPIKNVNNETFLGLENLVELSIDHAELSLLPTDTLKPMSRLETLSLRHNRFHVVPMEELRWLPQLKHLDLSGNPIVTINSNAFRHNSHLRTLNFINMPVLSYVEDCAFCNVHELRTLQMTNNSKLTDLDPEAFGRDTIYFRSIETIDLVNNSLTVLDEDLLHWGNITGVIRLAGNPWKCGCEVVWMTNAALKYDMADPPVCASPLRLKGKPIPNLNKYEPGLCLSTRLSGRIRAARVFLIAAVLIIIFGLVSSAWYLFNNRRKNGLKLRNMFYKPQLPKYAYRNLAMGEETDEVVFSNDGASILPKSNRKSDRDLASRLAEES